MIRLVKESDASRILEIYASYVREDSSTFDTEVATLAYMKQKINNLSSFYPYLVKEVDGVVVGYAYAHPYYGRGAYKWNVEVSIYLDKAYCHQGIGKELYNHLFYYLKQQGFMKAYACITASNQASIKMHEHFDFKQIGYFKEAGYKLNKWWDVVWLEKTIQPLQNPPKPIVPVWFVRKL